VSTEREEVAAPATAGSGPGGSLGSGPGGSLDIGAEIAKVREARGWTRRELSRRCGVADTTIARIERGAMEPTVATAARVLAALGRSLVVVEGGPRPGPRALVPGSLEEALVRGIDGVRRALEAVGCSRPRLTLDGRLLVDTPPGWRVPDSYALSGELLDVVDALVPVVATVHAEEDEIATARDLGPA